MRRSGVAVRPSARSVGIPAIKSRICPVAAVEAASAVAARSRVRRPMRIMNTGISGRVIATISADLISDSAMTTAAAGVTIAALSSAGRYPAK
ncbi:Uncharacterised protein [Mycobacteroides abscessus]|nr:Uncharacterised protein [Mycobacteroides abscessus]SIK07024.1 Uncharacterised protein [Mycobacteroides abscessus subsp. abscessus]SKU96969.1 Uncharacterised protein [Mycobacteroides abscessus subsp. abscessus]